MWGGLAGSYIEKAKALAETIDRQVNEAVGLPPGEGEDAAKAKGESAGGGEMAQDSDLMMDDAWNDDFDDDDDDDDDDDGGNGNDGTIGNHDVSAPPLQQHLSRGDSEVVAFDNDDGEGPAAASAKIMEPSLFDDDDDKDPVLSPLSDPDELNVSESPVEAKPVKAEYPPQQQQEQVSQQPTLTIHAAPSAGSEGIDFGMTDSNGWQEEGELQLEDVEITKHSSSICDDNDDDNNDEGETNDNAPAEPEPEPEPEPTLAVIEVKEEEYFQPSAATAIPEQEPAAATTISVPSPSEIPKEDVPEPPSPRHANNNDTVAAAPTTAAEGHHFFAEHGSSGTPSGVAVAGSAEETATVERQEQPEPLVSPPPPPLLEEEPAVVDVPEPPSPHPHETPKFFVQEEKTPSPSAAGDDSPVVVEGGRERGAVPVDLSQPADTWEDEMYMDDDDDDEEEVVEVPNTQPPPSVSEPQPTNNNNDIDNNMVNREEIIRLQEEHQMAMTAMNSQLNQLQTQIQQREDQLTSKAEQFSTMQAIFESEKEELRSKIRETKDEAKRRIGKAKERVQEMEKRFSSANNSKVEEAGAQEEIISALREEGEKLARKQGEMEKLVRSAKTEARQLQAELDTALDTKDQALNKVASLEAELKRTKGDLVSARKGESQADKLEAELAAARELTELKAASNLSLEQQVKELKGEIKDLREELEEAKKEANKEKDRSSKMLKREHSEMLSDLEMKLRTSEREANVREDALRHEVAELRKRWQDAVRRADGLSMDVQNSTAPLMRQLESTERQNRARAAAWAELETKLRSDLEEHVILNEKLTKERNELRTNVNRLQRLNKEVDEELASANASNEDQSAKVQRLEAKLLEMETEGQQMKEEWVEVERLANEGVAKVRSEMMQTVVESEERYRSQISGLEKQLEDERQKRAGFESQIEELAQNAGVPLNSSQFSPAHRMKEKKLKSTQGQAEILASTLGDLDSDYEDESDDEEAVPAASGFAAMEQLSQRLKASTVDLKSLRKQLAESEKTRESLVAELAETRQASEKLPLFEQKVKELSAECHEKELEIRGLQDDIVDVKSMYRSQLDVLLEEKASEHALKMNGESSKPSFASSSSPQSEDEQQSEN